MFAKLEPNIHSEADIRNCKHCGKILDTAKTPVFCCHGCETVFKILEHSGLSDYYRIKQNGVCFQSARPVPEFLFQGKFDSWKPEPGSTAQLYIEGIHCSACLWLLEKLPALLPSTVASCSLDLGKSVLEVSLKDGNLSRVAEQISQLGYTPHWIQNPAESAALAKAENKRRLVDVGVAGAIAGNVMLMSIPLYSGIEGPFRILFEWISALLAVPSLFYCGRSLISNVVTGFRLKTFPIDAPILLALVVAFLFSCYSLLSGTHQLYFDSLTALIFLLLSSRYYLARLRQSAEMSMGTLDFFQAPGDEQEGDLTSARIHQTLVYDGVLRKGDLWVDLSKFSGESSPVHLKPGDSLFAGTQILACSEANVIQVQKTGDHTRLAILLKKVEQCQKARTQRELSSDRVAKHLLTGVMLVAMFSLVYFLSIGLGAEAISRVLSLLIVTCPCALALATPLVFSLAMKRLQEKNVLVKDPNCLDEASQVSTLYFDKTGTLTEGHLSVDQDLQTLPLTTRTLLFSMVKHSSHPVSRAIYASLSRNLSGTNAEYSEHRWNHFEERSGRGLFAQDQAHHYSLVRAGAPQSQNTEVSFLTESRGECFELARISLSDQIRKDSAETLQKIRAMNYQIAILSGDHDSAAKKIARQLGIQTVNAELLPEQKANFVKGQMMVGDGLNDALALSKAGVSFAVQGGMEAAIHSSQIYSLKPGISGVADFLLTARKVESTLKINFAVSSTYNLLGAIFSLTGHMTALTAAILMPLSALSVFSFSIWRFKRT